MRTWLVALALALLAAPPPSAEAQRRGDNSARTLDNLARSPITRFRPRSDADRRGALTMLRIHINSEALGPSFTLTPRAPFVSQRGVLSSSRTNFNASFDTTGFHASHDVESSLTFHLFGLNANRVLIDCAVSGADGRTFDLLVKSLGQADDAQSAAAQNGRVYFATHTVSGNAEVHFRMDHAASGVQWILTGCEFTLLPTQ